MASMREAARRTYDEKINRMGVQVRTASMGEDVGEGHTGPQLDGTLGKASGGRAEGFESEAANERQVAAKAGKPRLDRKPFKNGGAVKKAGTTVNVIVAPQGGGDAPPPMMPPGPPPMPPPMPPPHMGPGGPGGPTMPPPGAGAPPGMPMGRKHGGRVPHMDAGAGGGKGRLEKIKAYGDNA